MKQLKKIALYYEKQNRSWYLLSHSTGDRTLYWGANCSPIKMKYIQNHSSVPSIPISCLAGLRGTDKYIGPLIGIMTTKGKSLPFVGNKQNFIDLVRAGKHKGGIIFVFTPEGVNWSQEHITGYLYHSSQRTWRKCRFPFPNVVYNRIPTRSSESSPKVQECIARFQETRDVTLFNPHFFNKLDLFSMLKKSEEVQSHLPDTKKLTNIQELSEMLNQHREIYLKPTKGKAGAGILKVKYDAIEHKFTFYSHKKNHPKQLQTKSMNRIWQWIHKYKSSSPYIVQQAVHLQKLKQCPFDFRILVQKNKSGKWEVTGIGTRVAGRNRITTHVPRGGRIENPNLVLRRIYSTQDALRVKNRMKKLAITFAKAIEKNDSILGEMSMDVGLDTGGKLWFFEANSKPMKFDEPKIRARSLVNLIEFCQYITFLAKG